MRLERVTNENIGLAVRVQEELFPGESGRANFEESLEDGADFEYYLICVDGECAGVIGLYHYPEYPESAWLGWFGVRERYRRRGVGTRAIRMFEEKAAERGFRFARLYTDETDNEAAKAFYRANGYVSERYLAPQDPACMKYPTVIFSKPLTDEPLIPWNNRNIHLTEQIKKQEKYRENRI